MAGRGRRWQTNSDHRPEIFQPSWRVGSGPLSRLVVHPTARFMRIEAAGGIVIVLGALVALIWANVDIHSYEEFWQTPIIFDFHVLTLEESLEGWTNDALMVIFFFVVGMEIKREVTHGELADRRVAAFPVLAALGGGIVPAVLFTVINLNSGAGAGWGIPVATDIAFAVGVLTLLGNRIPIQLKVFLLALAVADDIGGILIIAIFYTDALRFGWVAAALAFVGLILIMQRIGIRSIPAYILAGLGLWLAAFESGVHATIAGVALGLLIPAGALYHPERLPAAIRGRVTLFEEAMDQRNTHLGEQAGTEAIREIEELTRESSGPLQRVEHFLAPWSAFVVIPIFAVANAGVQLTGDAIEGAIASSVAWGIAIGLVVGKFVGVLLFAWLAVRLGLAVKPDLISWPQVAGVSALAGIGFTVAIFIAGLAYDDESLVEEAKIAILVASIIAAVLGAALLRRLPAPAATEAPAVGSVRSQGPSA